MAQRIATRALQTRLYSASVGTSASPATALPASQLVVAKARNGIQVATEENDSSLSRVVCAVKAGSRYEDSQQRGVTHCLRVTADLTQRQTRTFRLVRELHQMGGSITCTTSREHILYTLEVPRQLVGSALPLLTGAAFNQSFRPWEIGDSLPRLEYELLALSEQPDKRVVEKAHEAAYRQSGLGRSLYAPYFQVGQFSSDMLKEYVGKYFTSDRISFAGSGLDHSLLLDAANNLEVKASEVPAQPAARYHGGEIREETEDLLAYSMLVGEGASCTGSDVMAFAALEQLLGAAPQIRWASNVTSNRMNAALTQKTSEPFNVQSFNVNYSDSGIFGVSAVTVPENSDVVIKTAVEQLRALADTPVDAVALQGAKNRVKATIAFQEECPSDVVYSRAIQLLTKGSLTDLKSTLSAVDAVSAADVQQAAKKTLSSKLSLVSIGEIENVPYVADL